MALPILLEGGMETNRANQLPSQPAVAADTETLAEAATVLRSPRQSDRSGALFLLILFLVIAAVLVAASEIRTMMSGG